jgi:hypothetical protein
MFLKLFCPCRHSHGLREGKEKKEEEEEEEVEE